MNTEQNDIEVLRKRLRESLAKAPNRLSAASIQTVRDYKKRHAEAAKLLVKRSVTVAELNSAIQLVS
jgi:ABC-type proline/glycine betaine transport system substrate-binding protein